ncbi:Hint domain-containing protein [Cribrihabitans sp. XS_ASV171]
MATYEIAGFASYSVDVSNNDSAFGSTTSASVVLDDQEADNTWEEGDAVLNYTSTPSNDYLGKIEVQLVGGGTTTLPLIRGLASYTNPNVIEVLIVIPAGTNLLDYNFPNPIDYAARSTADFTVCFGEGTLIATPDGQRRVETLEIGETLLTADGRMSQVKWVGRQTVHPFFAGARAQPVQIKAGALGGGLPHSDLTVTADHGMFIDGLVINASALVNGSTIDFVPLADLPDSFTVYHIETEAHDVILANGSAAETFIDYRGRRTFDNYREYIELYDTECTIPELPYPRVSSQRLVPDVLRQRLGIARNESVTPLLRSA